MTPVEPRSDPKFIDDSYEIRFDLLFLLLWEKKVRLLFGITMGILAALLLSFFFKPVFQAKLTYLPTESSGNSKLQAITSQLGGLGGFFPGSSEKSPSEQMAILLQSRHLAEKVLKKVPECIPVLAANSGEPLSGGDLSPLELVTSLQSAVSVTIPYKNKPYELNVELGEAPMSARLANEYMSVLASHIQENFFSQSRQNRVYIENQVQKYFEDLTSAEEKLKEFQMKHRLLSIGTQTDNAIRVIGELKGRLLAREIEKEVLLKSNTPGSPEIKRLDDEIGIVKVQIKRLEEGAEKVFSDVRSSDLVQEVQLVSSSIASAPQLVLDFFRLKRNVDTFQRVHDLLVQQLILAKIQEQLETPSFTIVDRAEVPTTRIRPRRALFGLGGGCLGFFLALISILFHSPLNFRAEEK